MSNKKILVLPGDGIGVEVMQEVININSKKFLIIGVGLNTTSNPVLKKKYSSTNIYRK